MDQANRETHQLSDTLASAEAELAERQSQAQQLTAELEKARSGTDAAKTELAKREEQLGELASSLSLIGNRNRDRSSL